MVSAQIKPGIATISLGWHSSHTLEQKLKSASENGFEGVEMVYSDLQKYAEGRNISMLEAASQVKDLCAKLKLGIICLCAFTEFEGSPKPLEDRLKKAKEWISIARTLGTDMIQIPSNENPNCSGDESIIVSELQQLADLGKQDGPVIRFAYEALAWGVHVALWEDSLRIVNMVNRDNVGLCLDTYHILSRVWADARSPSGRAPGGDFALKASTERFLKECPAEKIFYLQLSDAEKQEKPILPGHPAFDINKDPTETWCFHGRLFPYQSDMGAYFPLDDIIRAWLKEKGWSGYCSMEIFHRDMKEKHGPEFWAPEGAKSWKIVLSKLK
jgi:sugar phosphate isomerase/epimerase